MRRPLPVMITLLFAVSLVAVGTTGCARRTAGPVPPGDAESVPGKTSASSAPSTVGAAGTTTSSVPATDQASPDATTRTMKVKLYFGIGDRVMAVQREVPYSQAVAKTAMVELLKGPSAAELKGLMLHSEIPRGTRVLDVSLQGHTVRVDFSGEFDDGGGTLSMTMRLAQVVYTLSQYSTVESVEFYMDGKKIHVFGGEGIELDGPQRPQDYYSVVPIDA